MVILFWTLISFGLVHNAAVSQAIAPELNAADVKVDKAFYSLEEPYEVPSYAKLESSPDGDLYNVAAERRLMAGKSLKLFVLSKFR